MKWIKIFFLLLSRMECPHCHIVFSPVDYDSKILTQTTNFKKNEQEERASIQGSQSNGPKLH